MGHPNLIAQAIEALRPGWGTCVSLGSSPATSIPVPPRAILPGRSWRGSLLGDLRLRSDLPALIDLYMDGSLDLDRLITLRLPFEEIHRGFAMMEAGEGIRTVVHFGNADRKPPLRPE